MSSVSVQFKYLAVYLLSISLFHQIRTWARIHISGFQIRYQGGFLNTCIWIWKKRFGCRVQCWSCYRFLKPQINSAVVPIYYNSSQELKWLMLMLTHWCCTVHACAASLRYIPTSQDWSVALARRNAFALNMMWVATLDFTCSAYIII